MGIKVNYNKKKSNKLKIIGIIIVVIIFGLIIIKALKNTLTDLKNNNYYSDEVSISDNNSSNEYTSLKEIFEDLDCKFISQEQKDDCLSMQVKFGFNLYDGEKSNEKLFTRLCNAVANFIDFENFEFIDSTKDIEIEVSCENDRMIEIKINGDKNYYLNHDSDMNKKLLTKVTEFTIQSPELLALIESNWEENKLNFGTKDSTCNGYNIYFEEGIKYKVVSKNIFNVIFTENYENEIAGTLKTTSTPEEVSNALGDPTFKDNDRVYGYLGKDNYLFFNFLSKEVSVYPVVKIDSNDEKNLKKFIEEMNESNDIKKFSTDLISMWTDFDIYDYDSNYVDLRYTLKGFQLDISSNSLKNGIFIYQNYKGNKNISELENVYIKENDLVFEEEKERSNNETIVRSIQGDYTDEELFELGEKFAVYFKGKLTPNEKGYKGPVFYSRDKEYPDTELDRTLVISSYNWYDEYNFIYSVNDDGIYVFNPATGYSSKLLDVEGEIIINSAGDGKIVYNEDKEISINMD